MGVYDAQINKAAANVMRRPASNAELLVYDIKLSNTAGYTYDAMVQEMLNTTGNRSAQSTTFPVARLFQAIFNRKPDSQGLDYWTGAYINALNVTSSNERQSLYSLVAGMSQSQEWANLYPASMNDTQFVQQLYRNTLKREGDAGGVQNWVNQIAGGVMTRAQVAAEFSASEEFKNLTNANIRAMLVMASQDNPNSYVGTLN